MERNGRAVVPPTCPLRSGTIDVETASFVFMVRPIPEMKDRIEIYAFFSVVAGDKTLGTIRLEAIVLPSSSDLVAAAYRIYRDKALQKKLRLTLLQTVKECTYACEALSKESLERAIRDVG